MKKLESNYEPNSGYAQHHETVRNRIASSFKKSYDHLNDLIKMIMNESAKIQNGGKGFLKDKESKKAISGLCKQVYSNFIEMKTDYDAGNLNQKKYVASLNILKVMIDKLPHIDLPALHETEILGECHRLGVVK